MSDSIQSQNSFYCKRLYNKFLGSRLSVEDVAIESFVPNATDTQKEKLSAYITAKLCRLGTCVMYKTSDSFMEFAKSIGLDPNLFGESQIIVNPETIWYSKFLRISTTVIYDKNEK